MMNRLLRLLKHDLNHVSYDQALNTFKVVLASLACHDKGVVLEYFLQAAKTLNYNESLVIGSVAESFGDDEFVRIKKTWDSLSPSEDKGEE